MFFASLFISFVAGAAPGLPKNKNVQFIDEGLRGRVEHNFSPEQMKNIEEQAEKHEFETEISKLMNILIDSLYENKDIFLREIISNANDALDKIRFQAIRDHKALENNKELQILIDVNEDDRTITVTDTGIGMTKQDLIDKLGTIARSGTNEFKKMLQSGDTSLIGQFGVGFYSTFLVADKVTVISKHNDDPKQWIWTSDSSAQFTIAEDPRGVTLGRGTQIIMHIKEKDYQYLNRDRLIAIARHYSMFVDFPVKIWQYHEEKMSTDEIPETENAEENEDDIFDNPDEVKEEDSDEEIVTIAEPEDRNVPKKIVWEWEQINNRQPIWMRDRNDISELEYNEFYKGAFKDSKNPMFKIHTCEEGRITFNALLYIPSQAPPADKLMQHTTRNVKLYVKRVLVSDEWNDELLPDYLHFIKGVIDSSDLSLNVDRDHLSKEGTLTLIKRRITNKIISELQHAFQFEPGLFFQFYKQYSAALKYGVIQDSKNKNSLAKLLLFYTSYSPNVMVTLDEYVSRMKTGQDKIYFIGSANRESAAVSPYLESLYSRGIEVIFAIEPIDLYCLERMDAFDGYKFENPETQNDKGSLTKDLMACNLTQREWSLIQRWFKKVLGDKIEKIALSNRLKATPAICTATNWGYTASHERLIRAQTVYDQKLTDNLQMNKKILEMNPEHPTIIELFDRIKTNDKDPQLQEDAKLIFETAMLAGGFTVDGVLDYTLNVFKMLGRSNGIEQKVKEFEEANKVYYTTMEDEFKATTTMPKRQKPKKNKEPKNNDFNEL